MAPDKPFSQACENNKQPILDRIRNTFTAPGTILEIGTGTGQHAVHFASALPHLVWQPSDRPGATAHCRARIREAALDNLRLPVELDVASGIWPGDSIDGAYSANTAHIMAWEEVEAMFAGLAKRMRTGMPFCLYGPFSYGAKHTSDSNRQFDRHLRMQAPHMGIRDMDDLLKLAEQTGFRLESDHEMPANNRLLVWRKL
ncbi:DUF938 domain-containing protein [Marinobacter orientalis]|uniref:DUF938 domain-containing protein n=1 Tax=Marinobacter orientalis TaxID=1928859 RepID=A0A7Y0REM2_9GAMM|nr:DUF938 domain-containing protein [Marinobacter orientalis]NMT64805.1 DUF938 domain-containing protein [Marinobacter orientalis]TGX48796.1 DUF938 domain-containing protein [Marinobacter orientalis]